MIGEKQRIGNLAGDMKLNELIIQRHIYSIKRYNKNMKQGVNMETIIYLIRHADTIDELGVRNTNETSQAINEKEILSIKGEEDSKELSEKQELKNIEAIWCSSYVRAKQTAKYIANKNNLQINLDDRLNERKLGNLKEIAIFMKDKITRDPSQEQLLHQKFKTSDGESAEDTNKRMTEFLNECLKKYNGKRIAIISHGGSIKFLLLNWCNVNNNVKLEYKGKELNIASPCLLKLTFKENNLVNLEQIS